MATEQKFSVSGMTCAACSAHVERAVRGVEGVDEVSVSLLTNSMVVSYGAPATAGAICDAVEAAGGMTGDAAETYLNLAETLSDGQKIEVPSVEMAEALEEAAAQDTSGLVNLNRATEAELMTLSGIGESKAKEIIRYRESRGGFQKPEDLMNIPGIKEGVFHKIRDQITV